jgi:hypothetical protein
MELNKFLKFIFDPLLGIFSSLYQNCMKTEWLSLRLKMSPVLTVWAEADCLEASLKEIETLMG